MARRVRKGVGMTERVVIQRDASDFPDKESFVDAFRRSLDAIEANCIPRNVRAENEKRSRKILAKAGIEPGDVDSERRLMEYGEDSPERLAGEWLRTFQRVENLKAEVESGQASAVMDLIDEAESLGVIQERFWWRCNADNTTGKRREALAIIGRQYQEKSNEGAAKRRGKIAPHTIDVPSEMQRLIESGHSVSNAARIAAKNGIGTSAPANRKIWYRRKNL